MAQFLASIRKLKSRLSHYLRRTRKGESAAITDRIVPMGQHLDQRLAAMCDTGQAQWSGRRLIHRNPVAKLHGRGSVAQLIVEDRD